MNTDSYIFCEEKTKLLFYGVFLGGVDYSITASCTSNQFLYMISMAYAVSNVAAAFFLKCYYKR